MDGIHHLLERKRASEGLEPCPHPRPFVRIFDTLMYVLSLIAPLAILPQVFSLFTYHNAQGLSLITWLLLGTINFFWSFYGFIHKEGQILISNIFLGILSYLVVIGIFLYR